MLIGPGVPVWVVSDTRRGLPGINAGRVTRSMAEAPTTANYTVRFKGMIATVLAAPQGGTA